jgi:hypothetical protein
MDKSEIMIGSFYIGVDGQQIRKVTPESGASLNLPPGEREEHLQYLEYIYKHCKKRWICYGSKNTTKTDFASWAKRQATPAEVAALS